MKSKNQMMLNWLESEKKKDQLELNRDKNKFIQEIKKIDKNIIFEKNKKLTLWQKIKLAILGT